MNIDNISFLSVIIGFFAAVIVSYQTVHRINERYEYSTDRPKSFKRYKSIYAVLSFTATFSITVIVFGIF